MLYDLNIPWTPSTDMADLDRILSFSASLGYNVVALNHTTSGTPPPSPLPPLPSRSKPKLLTRATVPLTDTPQGFRLASLAATYDILAVRPTTEKAFSAACLSISDVSLISLDLASRFNFHFRQKACMAAVTRGLRFEICYSQALASGTAPTARANFIANLASLVRATKGRGLVISSEARSALGLRAPADVVNLLSVWGLPKEKGMESLGTVPRGVVVNEGLRRSSFKGVVNILEVGGREGDDKKARDDTAKEKDGKAQPTTGKSGAQKRKSEETGQQQGQTLSKRQAKKMRLAQKAARVAEGET